MSFNSVATISAITEVVVILSIVLILANAFSDGYLVKSYARLRGRLRVKAPAAVVEAPQEEPLRRAA